MALKTKPNPKPLRSVNDWLDLLTPEDRREAEEYLRHPEMYGHKDLAEAFSQHEPAFAGTDNAVRRWREVNRGA